MSKIGKTPIAIPQGVSVEVEGNVIRVSGPKGSLEKVLPNEISVEKKEGFLKVAVKGKNKRTKSLHGTFRALISNMIQGVSVGFSKTLEMVGTGYRGEVNANKLILNVGFSRPVVVEAPEGVSFKVEKTDITVEGIDKELVGEVVAQIRRIRPPEPYKGKGIRYKDEVVRRKPGKAAKSVGGPA